MLFHRAPSEPNPVSGQQRELRLIGASVRNRNESERGMEKREEEEGDHRVKDLLIELIS